MYKCIMFDSLEKYCAKPFGVLTMNVILHMFVSLFILYKLRKKWVFVQSRSVAY